MAGFQLLQSDVLADADVVLHLHAQRGDLGDLVVHNSLGQAVFGDAVPQHAAHLGHGVVHRDLMALPGQEVGAGQAAGAAADDGHGLAGGGGHLGHILVLRLPVVVGGIGLQVADGDGLLHILAAAGLLAGVGAHPADAAGQGDLLLDEAGGLILVAQGDLLHIALTVGARGAVQRAGAHTVAAVVAHQQLQGDLAGLIHPLTVGVDHHAVGGHGGAGAQQLAHALGLHHAHAAGAVDLQLRIVAQVGNLDPVVQCDLQNSLSGGSGQLTSVDRDLDHFHCSVPP